MALLSLPKKPFDIVMSYVDVNGKYILSTFVERCLRYQTLLPMTDVCIYGLHHNNLELIEWAVSNSYDYLPAQRLAVQEDRLDALKTMKNAGALIDVCVPQISALKKHFETLRWCHSIGVHLDSVTTSNVASSGELGMLIWLIDEAKAEWSVVACHHAAARNDLVMLNWMLWRQAPFDIMAAQIATECGHLDALKLLWRAHSALSKEDKWVWDWKRIHEIAMKYNHISVIIWTREKEPSLCCSGIE